MVLHTSLPQALCPFKDVHDDIDPYAVLSINQYILVTANNTIQYNYCHKGHLVGKIACILQGPG